MINAYKIFESLKRYIQTIVHMYYQSSLYVYEYMRMYNIYIHRGVISFVRWAHY